MTGFGIWIGGAAVLVLKFGMVLGLFALDSREANGAVQHVVQEEVLSGEHVKTMAC